MEMTYSEPQTPLFPTHVILVCEKDHWKRGKSQHNTDCLHCTDVAVGIINIYPPNFCITYTNPAESSMKCCQILLIENTKTDK